MRDNIKMYIKEIAGKCGWINFDLDKDQWRTDVNTVINILFTKKLEFFEYLTDCLAFYGGQYCVDLIQLVPN